MEKPVDVLIITAADGEDEAVRLVVDGALGAWQETRGPEGYGFKVWFCDFETDAGRPMRVALSRAYRMGTGAAGNAAARLTDIYQPRCLAMCGVCAGNPKRTKLGDVIIADAVYRYDEGEQVSAAPGGPPTFNADTLTYPFKAQWTQAAQQFSVPEDAKWLAERPRPRELQGLWLLRELLEGNDPLASPDRETMCQDWTPVARDLQSKGFLSVEGGRAALTEAGRNHIQRALFEHAGRLPEQDVWRIHVGPLGTGASLVRDVNIWERLGKIQRHICGLDMEASVIGLTSHVQELPMIVVKGVMDYAEPERYHGFRHFAARASAEVLIGFLRAHLEPGPEKTPEQILSPNIRKRPSATNPGTLLNARYRVVDFFDEPRRAELDDLEAWCADARATSARLFVGPGGAGKTRLFIEWSRRLRERGWYAGFVPDRPSDQDMKVLLGSPRPTLVVVDYAECRPALLDLLRRVSSRPAGQDAPLRVALLAREVADWWRVLLELDEAVRSMLLDYEPARLEPVPVEGPLRLRIWERARDAFAKELRKPARLIERHQD